MLVTGAGSSLGLAVAAEQSPAGHASPPSTDVLFVAQAAERDYDGLLRRDAELAGLRVDTFCGQLEEE